MEYTFTPDNAFEANGTMEYPQNDDSYERFRSLTVLCEVLNIFVLVSTTWILLCVAVYGIKRKKWLDSKGRVIYFALFGATLLTMPDAFLVLAVFHLHDAVDGALYCERLMDSIVVTSTVSLLATYVFLWLRLRVIYNYKQMRVFYGDWIRYFSGGLLMLVFACIVGLGVIDIVPVTTSVSAVGCIYIHDANETRVVNWNTVRGLELAVTTLVQIAFLSLFVYPLVQTRRSVSKLQQKFRAKHDRILAVIKRYTICAAIVIASDIAAEIWIQCLPDGYPGVIRGTICGTDIFIDILCMVATFADYRIILTVLCRRKDELNGDDSRVTTLARKDSSEFEKRKMSMRQSS